MTYRIQPKSSISRLASDFPAAAYKRSFAVNVVAPIVGMSYHLIGDALGHSARRETVTFTELLELLNSDAYSETFVPRHKIPEYLLSQSTYSGARLHPSSEVELLHGSASDLIPALQPQSIDCVVTSSPYWGMRVYDTNLTVAWADGERCPYGLEQTPEGFVRHTVELLYRLEPAIADTGSVWWNIGDTYNTRTVVRRSSSEKLQAMKGDRIAETWADGKVLRSSAGHAYLKDGEMCLIPHQISQRASRVGYCNAHTFVWARSTTPESVSSRVSHVTEYVLHLTVSTKSHWNGAGIDGLPRHLGGRQKGEASFGVPDLWRLPTATGRHGHGAAFSTSLPGRCIALATERGHRILDPFIGSGSTALAAVELERSVTGFDVSESYLAIAEKRIAEKQAALSHQRLQGELFSTGSLFGP